MHSYDRVFAVASRGMSAMSLENSPALGADAPAKPTIGHNGGPALTDAYWFELIDEKEFGRFLKLTIRTLQKYRQTGNGPPFIRLSGRCVRYRRIDGHVYNESRLRASTSDLGPNAAAA